MAYDQIHIVDTTSQMIEVSLRSSTTGQLLTGKAYGDMTVKYQREGAAAASTVSVVTATKGTYTSGGFVETDIAGLYQFGIPAGALATGAKAVTLAFTCTGALDVVKRIVLIGADLRNATSLGLANLDVAVSSRSTYAGGDTSGVTTLLSRIIGTLATGTHNPQSGDAYARLIGTVEPAIADLPTNTELATALGTADDATIAAIAALNNLSSAQAQSAAAAALNAYDPPTNAEMEARTLLAANYFDPAADAVARVTLVDTTTTLTNMPAAAPTAAANADAVWDELLSEHVGVGSAGVALTAASSGGVDPSVLADAIWDEALSGHSTAGTTGKKLTDLANADLSSVATSVALADVPTVAEFEARTLPSADYVIVSDLPSVPSATDIKTELEADGGKLDHLWEMTEDDGGVRRLTTNALEQSPTGSGSGLTAQETADAVNNLAPTGASGAAGSIRDKLDAIKTTTNNIDVSAVTYVAASNAGHLTITSGLTFDESVENLIIPVDWETAYFTIKQSPSDFEEESIVQLIESNPGSLEDGLLRLNAVLWHEAVIDDILTEEIDETSPEPFSQSIGSLFVNQGAGSVRIYLTDELTTLLSPYKRIGWDVKFIDSSGDSTGKRGVVDIIKTETHTT